MSHREAARHHRCTIALVGRLVWSYKQDSCIIETRKNQLVEKQDKIDQVIEATNNMLA